jgi:poly(ADP-ribose) glycohydrolase ARH3
MDLTTVERVRAPRWYALEPDDVRDRVRGAMLGGACGDALGAPFERSAQVDTGEFALHRHARTALAFTDDTAMTMTVARHVLDCARSSDDLDQDRLATALAMTWREEPWRGYGSGAEQVFRPVLLGVPWRKAADGLHAGAGCLGNGAAVRVAPVSLLGKPLPHVVSWARRSARITHRHPIGQAGAALHAAAVALALTSNREQPFKAEPFLRALAGCHGQPAYDPRLTRLRYVLRNVLRGARPARAARSLGTSSRALESVPAALLAFLRSPDDPEQTLNFAVRLGGDTDSIAAMAGTLAGARCGASNLPAELLDRLEGAGELARLGDALADCALATGPVPAA